MNIEQPTFLHTYVRIYTCRAMPFCDISSSEMSGKSFLRSATEGKLTDVVAEVRCPSALNLRSVLQSLAMTPSCSILCNSSRTFFSNGTATRLGTDIANGLESGLSLIAYSPCNFPSPLNI